MIECCVCYDTAKKYTKIPSETKCEHPVCTDCFKQLLFKHCYEDGKKIPCPLCRFPIESPELEVSSAIERIENLTYECIYDPSIDNCDEIIFLEDDIVFINYEYEEIEKTSKRNRLRKFNYMNKIVPKNRNIRSIMKFRKC